MTIVDSTRGSVTIELGGRRATVQGEFYPIDDPGPTFEAYSKLLRTWDDGTILSDADRRAVLDDLAAEARARGWGEIAIL